MKNFIFIKYIYVCQHCVLLCAVRELSAVFMWVPYIICLCAFLYAGGYQRLFNEAPVPPLDGPITFVAPELPEETLLEVTVWTFFTTLLWVMKGLGQGDSSIPVLDATFNTNI